MAYIEIVKGKNAGQTFRLSGETFLGRTADNAISLPDTNVSRRHAVIRPKDGYFVITDLGSANGTSVNGLSLRQYDIQPLDEGAIIVICSSTMKFHAEGKVPRSSRKADLASGTMGFFSSILHIFKIRKKRDKAVFSPAAMKLNAGNQNPLPIKKAELGGMSAKGSQREDGMLTMVFSSESRTAPVSATLDASCNFLDGKSEEKDSAKELLAALKRLQAMVRVSNSLSAVTNPEILLEKIMESIFDVFPHADRAFIMLNDAASGEMVPKLGRSRGGKKGQEEFPVSRTIINTVTEKKQSILSSDALNDSRFEAHMSVMNLSIRSLMCAPFMCKDELLGIISVDNMSGLHSFVHEDLAMLASIAGQAAIAIKNADLFTVIDKETQVRTKLSRYLSKDLVEGVLDGTIPLHMGGEKKYGTVFFCDIVGFTVMAESLSAVEVVGKLNRYFAITTEIITRNRGTLHKFGGDMIMAFWNVMFADEHAQENAILASVEMQQAVWQFDCECEASKQPPVYIGIGCNTGEFAGGNVGGEDRMEYTIIGDNVNLAQRIESLASRWQVFVAEHTYKPAASRCSAIKLPRAQVKGKTATIQIYSIRGIRDTDGNMLLNIPVTVIGDKGTSAGQGMLFECRTENNTLNIMLSSNVSVRKGANVTLEFNIPEMGETIRMISEALDVKSCEGSAAYDVTLGNCSGKEALAFFKPGFCMESNKTWDQMKRH
ncbi:MAG: FHA domain-containing protein [Lentisphaerae bacterium]|nr:FHA domain-containing protein [Lentisphaerota bacterium]